MCIDRWIWLPKDRENAIYLWEESIVLAVCQYKKHVVSHPGTKAYGLFNFFLSQHFHQQKYPKSRLLRLLTQKIILGPCF